MRGPPGQLLERDIECGAIRDLLRPAPDDGAIVLVEAAAGLGKTELLRFAKTVAAAEGYRVLQARGISLERDFAFGVVRQLFTPLLLRLGAEERERMLAGAAALARPVLGLDDMAATASVDGEPGNPQDQRFAQLHGLYWLTAAAAQPQPLLIVVDDAHWADSVSLRFLAFLGGRIEALPVVLAVAFRPTLEADRDALLEPLEGGAASRRLVLSPLSRDASETMIRGQLGDRATDQVCEAGHRATGGNPFLLEEVLRELDTADPQVLAERYAVRIEPAAISRTVVGRLFQLPGRARMVATAAAVLGDGVTVSRLSRFVDALDPAELDAGLRALVRADILEEGESDRLNFVHPIVRTSIYAELSFMERDAAHRRALDVLEAEGEDVEKLAAHVLQTHPAGKERQVELLRAAARQALGLGAPEAAASYLERALREPPPPSLRAAVGLELGVAQERLGNSSAAIEHLEAGLKETDDPALRAALAAALARSLSWVGRATDTHEVLRAAITEAAAWDETRALRLEAQMRMNAYTSGEFTYEDFEQLDALPSRSRELTGAGLEEALVLASVAVQRAASGLATAEQTADLARTAMRRWIAGSPGESDSLPFYAGVQALTYADCLDEVLQILDASLAQARARGSAYAVAALSYARSGALLRRGRVKDARIDAEEAGDMWQTAGSAWMQARVLAYLVDALLEQGDVGAAADAVAQVQNWSQLTLRSVQHLHYTRGRVRMAQGLATEALEDFEVCGKLLADAERHFVARLPWGCEAALALVALGRHEEARELAARQLESAQRFGAARATGIALRAVALTKERQERIATLKQAAQVLAGSPALLEYARVVVDLGVALRHAGERVEARPLLEQGLDLAHRCGAQALVTRAHDELLACGARPRRLARSGVDALTASEQRVARLSSEGKTNNSIAQTLFVTTKTVEMHLGNVYRKLDITSRLQLPVALRDDRAPDADLVTLSGVLAT